MLVSAFRRTIELRRALIEAMARIENLEAALVAGKPLNVTVTAADAVAAIAQDAPKLLEAPPRVAEIAAEIDASDRIEPPGFAIITLGALLASFAALAAAQVRALSGQGGVVLALLVGAAVIAAAEWRRRDRLQREAEAPKFNADLCIAVLGIGVMLAAILYGRYGLAAVHAPAAVFGLAMLSLGAIGLSYVQGGALMFVALALAALAPAMSPIQAPGAWGQYAFLALFSALASWAARQRRARVLSWLALAPALFWGGNLAVIGGVAFNIGAGALFLAAITGIALLYAAPSAVALPFPRFWSAPWREPMWLGHVFAVLAAAMFATLLIRFPAGVSQAGAALLIFTIIVAGAGAVRPGLWLALALALVTDVVIVALWPLEQLDYAGALGVSGGAAALLGLAGAVAMSQSNDRRPGAWLTALAPIALLAACYVRAQAWEQHFVWSLAAAALLALNLFAALRLQTARTVAAAFIAGAALSGAALATMLTPPDLQPFALAASLPAFALTHRWRPSVGLRIAALPVSATLAVVLVQDGGARPWLLIGSGVAMCAAAFAYFYGRLPRPATRPKTVSEPPTKAPEPAAQPEMHS